MASIAHLFPHNLYSKTKTILHADDVMAFPSYLYPHMIYANYIPLSDAIHLLGSKLIQALDEVPVMYDEDEQKKRWMNEFEGFLCDLKAHANKSPVSEGSWIKQENHKVFDAFDAVMTNELKPDVEVKKIVVRQDIEEEEGVDEMGEFEDYHVMKHMRRQGAKRRRLVSKKHKYGRI